MARLTKLRPVVSAALLATGLWVLPAAAQARPSAGAAIHIRATVPLFCKISAPFDNQPIIVGADQEVMLGAVTEVCNSGRGYRVSAAFGNVESGIVRVDGASHDLIAGRMEYSHPTAALKNRLWSMANVVPAQMRQPIYVRVSISPI